MTVVLGFNLRYVVIPYKVENKESINNNTVTFSRVIIYKKKEFFYYLCKWHFY